MEINSQVAECVGLWLAEGDNKTKAEITFTNNCFELILFFQKTINKIYNGNNKPRLYIYSPTKRQLFSEMKGFKKINFYIDERARRTYYIYRLADVKFVRFWKKLVEEIKEKPEFYADILRGFFAGEGNVHHSPQCNNHRSVRISCGTENKYIEKLMDYFKLKYNYNNRRAYEISGPSLNVLFDIKIASLHPEKECKFNKMINSVKEKHYSPLYLKKEIYKKLNMLYTARELSNYFDRSMVWIQEILYELKRKDKIKNIQIKNKSLWAKKK